MALPEELSSQYRYAIACAAAHDVIEKTEPFRPNSPATRAEMAELLVRGMTPYIWAYLSPRSEPTLAPCTRKPILDIRQSSC